MAASVGISRSSALVRAVVPWSGTMATFGDLFKNGSSSATFQISPNDLFGFLMYSQAKATLNPLRCDANTFSQILTQICRTELTGLVQFPHAQYTRGVLPIVSETYPSVAGAPASGQRGIFFNGLGPVCHYGSFRRAGAIAGVAAYGSLFGDLFKYVSSSLAFQISPKDLFGFLMYSQAKDTLYPMRCDANMISRILTQICRHELTGLVQFPHALYSRGVLPIVSETYISVAGAPASGQRGISFNGLGAVCHYGSCHQAGAIAGVAAYGSRRISSNGIGSIRFYSGSLNFGCGGFPGVVGGGFGGVGSGGVSLNLDGIVVKTRAGGGFCAYSYKFDVLRTLKRSDQKLNQIVRSAALNPRKLLFSQMSIKDKLKFVGVATSKVYTFVCKTYLIVLGAGAVYTTGLGPLELLDFAAMHHDETSEGLKDQIVDYRRRLAEGETEKAKVKAKAAREEAEKAIKDSVKARLDANQAWAESNKTKDEAVRARLEAQKASVEAVKARHIAEKAKLVAETDKAAHEAKMTEYKTQKANVHAEAERARKVAEEARVEAETAIAESVKARDAAETAIAESVKARDAADKARVEADKARVEADKASVKSETEKAAHEAKRAEHEAEKADVEAAAEKARREAEEAKAEAAKAKQKAEAEKKERKRSWWNLR